MNVQEPDHRRPPRFSAVRGSSASIVMALERLLRRRLGALRRRAASPSARADCARSPRRSGRPAPCVTGIEGRLGHVRRRAVARAAGGAPGAGREELLDDPVLERMEGHDHEPPAGLQHPLGRVQRAHEFAEFVIDGDAQRLEHPRRRMHAARLLPDQRRRRDRRAAASSRCGCLRRVSTIARATARARRSSP